MNSAAETPAASRSARISILAILLLLLASPWVYESALDAWRVVRLGAPEGALNAALDEIGFLLSCAQVVGAWGLWRRRHWGRLATAAAGSGSIVALVTFNLSTALTAANSNPVRVSVHMALAAAEGAAFLGFWVFVLATLLGISCREEFQAPDEGVAQRQIRWTLALVGLPVLTLLLLHLRYLIRI